MHVNVSGVYCIHCILSAKLVVVQLKIAGQSQICYAVRCYIKEHCTAVRESFAHFYAAETLPFTRIARENPRISAVVEDMLSTSRCLNFFRAVLDTSRSVHKFEIQYMNQRIEKTRSIQISSDLPSFGSTCSLLYRMVTSPCSKVVGN